ncbi:MAG: enoyl-CoA hydratase/isomerase family protein [Acidimicrobiia bacterium]
MSPTDVPGLRVGGGEQVLELTLDRPERRNAIDDAVMHGLIDAFEWAATSDARVVVLRGAGDHFCGGADIVARNDAGGARPRVGSIQRRLPTQAHRLIEQIVDLQVPVVAVVRGWAAGIGFQLALAADFCVATEDARFWEPFGERGFTPDSGATWLLPRRVGEVRARELLLLGRALDGAEAAAWGAIHRAVPPDALDATVADLVDRLAAGPTVAIGLTKRLLHRGRSATLADQLVAEAYALELSSRTEDFREGLAAFREKRPPEFGGR